MYHTEFREFFFAQGLSLDPPRTPSIENRFELAISMQNYQFRFFKFFGNNFFCFFFNCLNTALVKDKTKIYFQKFKPIQPFSRF